jgi:hypothetical protein
MFRPCRALPAAVAAVLLSLGAAGPAQADASDRANCVGEIFSTLEPGTQDDLVAFIRAEGGAPGKLIGPAARFNFCQAIDPEG